MQSHAITNTKEIITQIKKVKLDGIEFNTRFLELLRIYMPEWNLSLNDFSTIGTSLHSNFIDFNLGSINPYIREAGINQLKDEIILAEKYGIKNLTIHPGRVKKIDRSAALNLFWDSLSEIYSSILPGTTGICLENMDQRPEKFCNNIDEIRATLEKFPQLYLTLDLAHLGYSGIEINSFLDEFIDRIAHIHISGMSNGFSHHRISLSKSKISFQHYLKRFIEKDIIVVIENYDWDTMLKSLNEITKITKG